MISLETEICVVGSGVAGAIVARQCLDAGMHVTMVEAGGRSNGRAFGLRVLEKFWRDYRFPRMRIWHRNALYARQDNLASSYPVRGRALVARGGTTLGWTGDAYRMMPEDFECRARTGIGTDWPLSYDALESFYCLAEETLRVAGSSADGGQPPRSCEFPFDPAPFHARDAAFLDEFKQEGPSAMHHNVAHAKDGSVFVGDELIDELETRPNFRLLLSTVASRIESRDSQTATSLLCTDTQSNSTLRIGARCFVVCAGGIESPILLFNSKNQWWPDGLGNHSGHLGRHLTTHGGVAIGGRPRGLRHSYGPILATAASRAYDSQTEQKKGKFLLIWRPAPTGFMFLNAIFEQFSDANNLVRPAPGNTRFGTPLADITFDHGDQYRQRQQAIAERMEVKLRKLGVKATIRHKYMLAHHMCTTRMSTDPNDGVLDSDLRIHSANNVYVCGGSSFSSGGAANPTVTVAALAHRLGCHLASNRT